MQFETPIERRGQVNRPHFMSVEKNWFLIFYETTDTDRDDMRLKRKQIQIQFNISHEFKLIFVSVNLVLVIFKVR